MGDAAGHGASGDYLLMSGPQNGGAKGSQRYRCTQSWWNSNPAAQQQSCLIFDSINPQTNTTLSAIFLTVLIRCGQFKQNPLTEQVDYTESALAQDFINHGAQCVVEVGLPHQTEKYAHQWLDNFLQRVRNGWMFGAAASAAAAQVNDTYRQGLSGQGYLQTGATDIVVSASTCGYTGNRFIPKPR